jgi:hypothetical protein
MPSFGFPEIIIMMILFAILLGTVFWIWMLVECAVKEPNNNEKIVWIIIIAVTHLIGALIYFIVKRPKRISSPITS